MFLVIGSAHCSDSNTFVPFKYVVAHSADKAQSIVDEKKEEAKKAREKQSMGFAMLQNFQTQHPEPNLKDFASTELYQEAIEKWKAEYVNVRKESGICEPYEYVDEQKWSYEEVAIAA